MQERVEADVRLPLGELSDVTFTTELMVDPRSREAVLSRLSWLTTDHAK
jgi:hypothetical protein